jgi:hypothetical protein
MKYKLNHTPTNDEWEGMLRDIAASVRAAIATPPGNDRIAAWNVARAAQSDLWVYTSDMIDASVKHVRGVDQ